MQFLIFSIKTIIYNSRPSIGAVRDYEGVVMAGGLQQGPVPTRNYSDYEMLARMRTSNLRMTPVQLQQPQSHPQTLRDYDSVNFTSRKDYEPIKFRPPQVAPKPRLSSVDEAPSEQPPQRRPPPPLPPKPVRGPPPLPPHAQHLHNNFGKGQPGPGGQGPQSLGPDGLPMGVTRTKNGVFLGMPGEKGYNVSFV